MKLSRYTLALCLAATIGLSVSPRQAQCQGRLDNPARSAEKLGSPSYQAAQNYDSYDCFAAGCHAGYGDIVPDLYSDESNVREEGLPPEPENVDADLPGDEPSRREIPTNSTKAPQAPASNDGFAGGDQAPTTTPPRGYFSPGYPHPGYMHPNYGYSHTEIIDDSAALTEQQVTADAAAEESLVAKAVTQSAEPHSQWSFQSVIEKAMAAEGYGEDTLASETLQEEPVAKTATEDLSQEYARYDDTYGYESEWFGPYDATKVEPKPVAEKHAAVDPEPAIGLPADHTLTSQYEDRIEEVDPAPAIEADDEPIVDYGPAELEVDATTAADISADDEDAAFEAAIRESHDDWFYRETYGYGPRYDYDMYGYEDFPVAGAGSASRSLAKLPRMAKELSEASQLFLRDYVYRPELNNLLANASAAVQIPFAPQTADLSDLAAEDAAVENDDPAIPAGSDFDPAAIISAAGEKLSQIDGNELLSDAAWWSRTLTPMELARLALAATPVVEREYISVLIPQPKVVEIQPLEPAMDADEALRELAAMLDNAGQALQMLSRRVEAFADATSHSNAAGDVTPLQSRNPAGSETR